MKPLMRWPRGAGEPEARFRPEPWAALETFPADDFLTSVHAVLWCRPGPTRIEAYMK